MGKGGGGREKWGGRGGSAGRLCPEVQPLALHITDNV